MARLLTVRAITAIMIVGVFMRIIAVIALFPLFSKTNVELGSDATFFNKTASVYRHRRRHRPLLLRAGDERRRESAGKAHR